MKRGGASWFPLLAVAGGGGLAFLLFSLPGLPAETEGGIRAPGAALAMSCPGEPVGEEDALLDHSRSTACLAAGLTPAPHHPVPVLRPAGAADSPFASLPFRRQKIPSPSDDGIEPH